METKERGTILIEALETISEERVDTYGKPENSFPNIARLWNAYIEVRFGTECVILDAKDTAIMMSLFKLVREASQGKRDNLVDAIGYLAIAADL